MKLSPRINIRMQSGNSRRAVIVLVALTILVGLIVILVPVRELFFSFPSWRNVSIYQIVKMHLSTRPSHVGQVCKCSNKVQPGVQRSDLRVENIQLYEQAREQLGNLTPDQQWMSAFRPALNKEDKITLMLAYAVFKFAMDGAGLDHIVMHGSAMGAWRHHGLTPWDDDIDIAVHVRDWLKIKLILSCIEGYTLDVSSNSKWSFFNSSCPAIDDSGKRWPFLDIFLYSEDENYVWGLNYIHLRKFVFPKEDMFPVQTVPFECFMVPVPRHLRRVLEHQYVEPEICVSHHTNHKTGGVRNIITVPCVEISNIYSMHFTYN